MNPMQTISQFEEWLTVRQKSAETIRSYIATVKRFLSFKEQQANGPVSMQQIQEDDVLSYVAHLQQVKTYKSTSINVILNALRTYFKFAMRHEWVKENPMTHIDSLKTHKVRRDYLNSEEIQALIENIKHPLGKLIARTLAFTGLRISECLNLTLDDVDFENNMIHVQCGKGGKPRYVPLAASLKPYLEEYVAGKRKYVSNSKKFFATERTGSISPAYFNRLLKLATEELGWDKHVTAHVLRHSFASELVRHRVDLPQVAALLGHSDFRTVTSVYVHISDDELHRAVEQIRL